MLTKLHKCIPDSNQTEYMSFFAFNPELFHCEVLEPLSSQDRPFYSLTIDYPDELELARKIYRKLSVNGSIPSIESVIQFLDQDSTYKSVDKGKLIKLPNGNEMKYEELISMLDETAKKAYNVTY